jgi:outer membrane biosynthesis protein TonB
LARSSGFALFDREARETVLRRWRFENGDAVREPFGGRDQFSN